MNHFKIYFFAYQLFSIYNATVADSIHTTIDGELLLLSSMTEMKTVDSAITRVRNATAGLVAITTSDADTRLLALPSPPPTSRSSNTDSCTYSRNSGVSGCGNVPGATEFCKITIEMLGGVSANSLLDGLCEGKINENGSVRPCTNGLVGDRNNNSCLNGFCDEGTCRAYGVNGSPCTIKDRNSPDFQCGENLRCNVKKNKCRPSRTSSMIMFLTNR